MTEEKDYTPIQKANNLLERIRKEFEEKFEGFTQVVVADSILISRTRVSNIETDKNTAWKNPNYVFGYYSVLLKEEAPELIEVYHILADTQCISTAKWKELKNKKEADDPYDRMLLEKIQKAKEVNVNDVMRKYMP